MNLPATNIESMTLRLSRHFPVPCEKVFKAWTDPDLLTQWFGPPGVTTKAAAVDLRVGGKYLFTMQEPDGNVIDHGGEYRLIDPPRNLVFTWVLDGQSCAGSEGQYVETMVTLEFENVNGSCQLHLTHELLPGEASKEGHHMGWIGSLDRLEEMIA